MRRFLSATLILMGIITVLTGSARADYSAIYGTYIDYSSGSKIGGPSLTGYYSTGNLTRTYSFGLSLTSIKYSDNYTSSATFKRYGISNAGIDFLNQLDVTVEGSVTNELLKNHTFTFGLHYIITNDNLTNNGIVFYFDGTYFKPYNWNSGVEFAVSYYPETIDLQVIQLSPHFGKYYYTTFGTFYGGAKFYYITLNKPDEIGVNDKNFYSTEVFLNFYRGKTDLGFSVWKGEQVFAVKNSGFVVYNLTEKYESGVSVEGGYYFTKNYRLGATISINKFEDLETGNDVTQTVVTVSLGYKW
ncbi:hypothetical protein [Desulfurobacterium indicum]|uniref:Uncharacterized protein n=1 Tax=Desulfurobacterium indicum TaxID=1914305 RepID=A0A1R1MJH6_9BACT|nr:hypothetical protein [Desulfurobacterium indicum]OMH39906.1 hypothetical protein BLW93_08035 [Desulfurobacterium indicum]